jgi:hypothetical protein
VGSGLLAAPLDRRSLTRQVARGDQLSDHGPELTMLSYFGHGGGRSSIGGDLRGR